MRIPRYWARAEGDAPPDTEGPGRIVAWGWSDDNHVEAQRHARQRLTELLDQRTHEDAGQIVDSHDRRTKTATDLPLA